MVNQLCLGQQQCAWTRAPTQPVVASIQCENRTLHGEGLLLAPSQPFALLDDRKHMPRHAERPRSGRAGQARPAGHRTANPPLPGARLLVHVLISGNPLCKGPCLNCATSVLMVCEHNGRLWKVQI